MFKEPVEKKKPLCADAGDSGLSPPHANSSSSVTPAASYIGGPGAAVRLSAILPSRKEIGRHSQAQTAIVGASGFAAGAGTQDRPATRLSSPRGIAATSSGEFAHYSVPAIVRLLALPIVSRTGKRSPSFPRPRYSATPKSFRRIINSRYVTGQAASRRASCRSIVSGNGEAVCSGWISSVRRLYGRLEKKAFQVSRGAERKRYSRLS